MDAGQERQHNCGASRREAGAKPRATTRVEPPDRVWNKLSAFARALPRRVRVDHVELCLEELENVVNHQSAVAVHVGAGVHAAKG